MTDERKPGSPRELWQSQPLAHTAPSAEEIRRRSQAAEKTIRRRNLREYAMALLVVLFFAWHALTASQPTAQVGSGLIVAGTLFVVWQLATRGSVRCTPEESAFRPCLDFYRAELSRQRDLLATLWWWYLLPLLPGLAVLLGGHAWAYPESRVRIALFAGFFGLICLGLGLVNQWVARQLQEEIDELEKQR